MIFSFEQHEDYYTFFDHEDDLITSDSIKMGTFVLDFIEIDIPFVLTLFQLQEKTFEDSIDYSLIFTKLCQNDNKRLIILMYKLIKDIYLKSKNDNPQISLSKVIDETKPKLIALQNELKKYISNINVDEKHFSYLLQNARKIEISFFYDNNTNSFVSLYEATNLFSFISLDLINIHRNRNIKINCCENCNKLFIPSKRSDEIYCDRIYYKNKTCKEIGYSQKIKDDPFKAAYTKARKTQHARIRYNAHIEDYKSKHYEPWKKAAEQAKRNFESKNDIAGFEKWLKDNKNTY